MKKRKVYLECDLAAEHAKACGCVLSSDYVDAIVGEWKQAIALERAENDKLEDHLNNFLNKQWDDIKGWECEKIGFYQRIYKLEEALKKIANDEGMCGAFVCKDAAKEALQPGVLVHKPDCASLVATLNRFKCNCVSEGEKK